MRMTDAEFAAAVQRLTPRPTEKQPPAAPDRRRINSTPEVDPSVPPKPPERLEMTGNVGLDQAIKKISKMCRDPAVVIKDRSLASFRLILPWPPTANTATRHPKAGVHYLTQAHRTFRTEVAWIVTQARASTRGKYRMEVVCHPPDRRRRDFDNIQKTLCDALVKAGAIEDDCLMRELQVTWNDWRRIEVPRVIVRVQELEQRA